MSYSMSRSIDKQVAVRVTNTTESSYLIKKNTHIAEFFVVTPEESKFNKAKDAAILTMTPEADLDLTTYLSDLLRSNKQEQQCNTFWFSTTEKPGKTEDHLPIQTQILREMHDSKDNEKSILKDDKKSRTEFLQRNESTDTQLTEVEKQAVDDLPIEYHDIFARQKEDIEMITELKMKLTTKADKTS